jgi:DNA-directed RNA polymerase II subunit RPB1
MSELMDLAAVPYHILAPRDGKPMVEIVQDTLVGAFRLTKDWTRIHDKTMANLQMHNSYFVGALPAPTHKKDHQYSGKQAYSQILPPGLFVDIKNKADEKFKIYNSEIMSGTIDKNVYHSLTSGIMPILYHDYSPFEVRRFIDNTQRLICSWLTSAGFSVGISDLVTDKVTEEKLKTTISTYKGRAYSKLEELRKGQRENKSIFTNEDFFEREILNVLNDLTKEVGSIGLKQIDDKTNRMINMVKSGSKGKETNVAQMIACVGQQNVDGKRVAYGFTDRTLPHYTKYDDGPEARGFVENSFISGLSPQEVFFHAMGGREGLIDTAVKTSETGYIQRRLVKAMEDCKIYYDQSVRNATGAVVQFLYGEDGIEGTKVENQYVQYVNMNAIEMDATFHLRPEDPLNMYLTQEAMDSIKAEGEAGADVFGRCDAHFEQLTEDRLYLITKVFKGEKSNKIQYAIPFERIIRTSLERLKICGDVVAQTDLTPSYVLDRIDELIKRLKIVREGQGVRFLHILLRLRLSPKPLIFDMHMTKQLFDWVVTEIERFFVNAVAQPGEMVGIVAAQSIGELGTQATLDSFHSSGTAAAVKATSGVPRLKELLSVSKHIKTPTLLIYMKPDISSVIIPEGSEEDTKLHDGTKQRSMKVMHSLEITRLYDILDGTDIYWDPPGDAGVDTGVSADAGMMDIYKAFSNADPTERCTSPWVLRLRINKEKIHRIGLTMMDVYIKMSVYNQTTECLFSDDNAPELIFRIRMNDAVMKDVSQEDAISALKAIEYNLVHNILLKGVKGIKKVSMRLKNRDKYNEEMDAFEKIGEWVLDTDGTNLQNILADPNVDAERTRSNDIYEIYQVLGVEAARNALYQEFMEVVGDGSINYRHMSLLIDTMTNRGNLMSVDRHGINRGDIGPLAKSSFEETTDMLINASVFAEYDRINGVSANIMLGQLPPCGTGDNEILLDEDAYLKIMRTMDKSKKRKNNMKYIPEIDENVQQVFQEGCSVDNIAFTFKLPEKREHVPRPTQTVTFI